MASKRKAGGRPKKGTGPNKSNFIRKKLKAGLSASDIVKAGSASGMKISSSLVYAVKGRAGAKLQGRRGRKPKNGKVTASDFIRSQPAGMKAKDVIDAAVKAGFKRFGTNLVYLVRSKMT